MRTYPGERLSPISYTPWSLHSYKSTAKKAYTRQNTALFASLHIHDARLISNSSENLSIRCLPSTILRDMSIISSRWLMSQRNTPAASRCATHCSSSDFALLMHCDDKSNADNSSSCSEFSEQSSRYASGGINETDMGRSLLFTGFSFVMQKLATGVGSRYAFDKMHDSLKRAATDTTVNN